MLNYTKEQLIAISNNIDMVSDQAKEILEVMKKQDQEVKTGLIQYEVNAGKFVVDKCLAVFIACGFVSMRKEGTLRYYKITEDGKKFLNIKGV